MKDGKGAQMSRTTVAVADDDVVVREILSAYISLEPSMELVGMAEDAEEAIELASTHRPNVMLVDVTMPGRSGPETVKGIHLSSPATRILAFSAHEDRETMRTMLAAGASSYLLKGTPPDQIMELIRRAAKASALHGGVETSR
jgi:DNA-binding NarL/FixJ family response regulator